MPSPSFLGAHTQTWPFIIIHLEKIQVQAGLSRLLHGSVPHPCAHHSMRVLHPFPPQKLQNSLTPLFLRNHLPLLLCNNKNGQIGEKKWVDMVVRDRPFSLPAGP